MLNETALAVLTMLYHNFGVQIGLSIIFGVCLGWLWCSFLAKKRLKRTRHELVVTKERANELAQIKDTLAGERAQTLQDAADLRAESIAENDSLKVELDAAHTALDKSKSELVVLTNQMPQLVQDPEREAAMRDALALAKTDINQLSQELDTKSKQIAKLKNKADIAVANAVDLKDATPKDPSLPDMAGWRARFFESRIRLLEAQLEDQNAALNSIQPVKTMAVAPIEPPPAAAKIEPADPNAPNKDEELASLRWRVRYLETRLASADIDIDPQDDTPLVATGRLTPMTETPAGTTSNISDMVRDTPPNTDSPIKRLADIAHAQRQLDEAKWVLPKVTPQKPNIQGPPDLQGDSVVLINGIGPVVAKALSKQGITTVAQLAKLTLEEGLWLENEIGLGGRLFNEDWIGKAQSHLPQRAQM